MAEEKIYDEDNAVKLIRNYISESCDINDDDILFIIDCIWDYYDDNGLLDMSNTDEEDNIDFENMLEYIKKCIIKDGLIKINDQDLRCIIKGELDYEESLDIFGD